MKALKAICENLGFEKVQTYIASGNVVFRSSKSEDAVEAALEAALRKYGGQPVDVYIRTPAELLEVAASNPFPNGAPNHTVAIFLNESPPPDTLRTITGVTDEDVRLGNREIYVHYPSGIARSKLKIPAARGGTMRNMSTITKLARLGAAL